MSEKKEKKECEKKKEGKGRKTEGRIKVDIGHS